MKLSNNEILKTTQGSILNSSLNEEVFAYAVKIDSREVSENDLFLAIKGENVDGNDYIESAILNGASVVICEKNISDDVLKLASKNFVSIIKVEDSVLALQAISKLWREKISVKVIGITGSVGKTTVKNLISQSLANEFSVTANKGNLNNEIGLPVTLCASNADDDFVVTEMGMNHFNEIQNLCDIAKPTWGVISNIGDAHLEYLKTRENIALEKSRLAVSLPNDDGKLFLNACDDFTDFIINETKVFERGVDLVLFGGKQFDEKYDCTQVWYENYHINDYGKVEFDVSVKKKDRSIDKQNCVLSILGEFNVVNACAAIAVLYEANISLNKICEYISKVKAESGRLEILKAKKGFTIINDAYNASPKSMLSSINVFSNLKTSKRKIAFLGDMLELGDKSYNAHEDTGTRVAKSNIDILFCVGNEAKYIMQGAQDCGMAKEKLFYFNNNKDAVNKLNEIVQQNDIVLFKASNGMKLQEIVQDYVD